MLLYHGSNVAVPEPKLLAQSRRLDFGPGFYLTSDLVQAQRWAQMKMRRLGEGRATVTIYEVDEDAYRPLRKRIFQRADAEWLHYVVARRRGTAQDDSADVIIGPVANDQTMPTISEFLRGGYTVAETLRRLRVQQLKDQYVFRTPASLASLRFKGCQEP